jgi:hypothetical protein
VLWISIGFNANPDSHPGQKIEILLVPVLKRLIDFFQKLQYRVFSVGLNKGHQALKENIQHSKQNISKNCESGYQQRPIVDAIYRTASCLKREYLQLYHRARI